MPVVTTRHEASLTPAQALENLLRYREQHFDLLNEFARVWYSAPHTWSSVNVLGVPAMKCPFDLWNYHDLMVRQRPRTVIETGTAYGGSAFWFATLMDVLGITDGQVLTIDIDPDVKKQHPRVSYLTGSSTDPVLVEDVLARATHPLLISLDSEHSAEHVQRELELYAPAVDVGEYLVVEDTNVSWPDDPGPRGALLAYLDAHPDEFVLDLWCERFLLTMHPEGWLRRRAPHQERTRA